MPVPLLVRLRVPTVAGTVKAAPTVKLPVLAALPMVTLVAVMSASCAVETFRVPPALLPTCILLPAVLGTMLIVLVPAFMVLPAMNVPRLPTVIVIGSLFAAVVKLPKKAPVPRASVPVPRVEIERPELPLAVTVEEAVLPTTMPILAVVVLSVTASPVTLPLTFKVPPDDSKTLLPAPPVITPFMVMAPVPAVVRETVPAAMVAAAASVSVPVPPVLAVRDPVPTFIAPVREILLPSVPALKPPNKLPLLKLTLLPATALAEVMDAVDLVEPVDVMAPTVTPLPMILMDPAAPGVAFVELVFIEPSVMAPVAKALNVPPLPPAELELVLILSAPAPALRLMKPALVALRVKVPDAGANGFSVPCGLPVIVYPAASVRLPPLPLAFDRLRVLLAALV